MPVALPTSCGARSYAPSRIAWEHDAVVPGIRSAIDVSGEIGKIWGKICLFAQIYCDVDSDIQISKYLKYISIYNY